MGILHVRLDKKCNFLRITETKKDHLVFSFMCFPVIIIVGLWFT